MTADTIRPALGMAPEVLARWAALARESFAAYSRQCDENLTQYRRSLDDMAATQ